MELFTPATPVTQVNQARLLILLTRILHRGFHRTIEQRHQQGHLSSALLLRLKMLELVECVTRLHHVIPSVTDPEEWPSNARRDRRDRSWWATPMFSDPEDLLYELPVIKQRMADVYIVLATMERELANVTGREWSMVEAARQQVTSVEQHF